MNKEKALLPKAKSLLPVKSDFIFKLIFGDQRNIDILAGFLCAVLDISADEFDYLTIIDPHIKKESDNDKYGILDVKVHTKSGIVIHIEVQLWSIPEMKPRSIYYQSKMITEQLFSGQNYDMIKRVVSIIITDYNIITSDKLYHHQFRYRTIDNIEFTDLTEINTLELQKLPFIEDNTELWYWMKFIKSDGEEEVLDMIAEKNPQIKKAIGILKELSADERTRMLFEEREKARRDIASMVDGAKKERNIEIAKNLIEMDMPINKIVKVTGLTKEEVESLS